MMVFYKGMVLYTTITIVEQHLPHSEIWGLMSKIGVPSIMSACFTIKILPDMLSTKSTDNPMGLGRTGEQILKTPMGLDLYGGDWTRC